MKFCTDCGKTLSILNDSKSDYCNRCRQKRKAKEKPKHEQETKLDTKKLLLSCENDKIILKSEEGWLLWSGSSKEVHSLDQVLARGEKILAIRRKITE